MAHTRPSGVPVPDALLDAAAAVVAEHGFRGLTLERLAARAGTSRMTLHRRSVSVPDVVAGLAARALAELQSRAFTALVGPGTAADRLVRTLRAVFAVADEHLPLLAGLFADDGGVFHAPPAQDGSVPTADVFVAPLARLLLDGALDGSLRPFEDVTETATVLFNTAGWGYVQLRHAQGWPAARASRGVLDLVLGGLRAGAGADAPRAR